MVMLILGVVFIAVGLVLDLAFRERMSRNGHKLVFRAGGLFDYSRYHKVREEHGWAAWPVYLMGAAYTCGIALLIAGFFAHFGTNATLSR